MSFRRRVVLLSAGAVAVAIAIAAVAAYLMVAAQMRGQVDRNLEKDASGVSAVGLALGGPSATTAPSGAADRPIADRILIVGRRLGALRGKGDAEFMRLFRRARRAKGGPLGAVEGAPGADRGEARIVLPRGPLGTPELYAQVVSSDGAVTRPPDGLMLPSTERVDRVASGESEPFFYETELDGIPLRVYVTSVGGGRALQVARPLTEVESTLDKLALVLGVVTLGGIGLAVGLGFFVSRAALAPVARLTETAESIAESRDLAHRMEVVGDDELARLARSFNTMLAALEQSLGTQRQLVADASHELRTPLTSLKTNVEVLLRSDSLSPEKRQALMESVVAQIDEVVQLIGDLIDLARESESEERMEALRLDETVEGVVERAGHRSEDVRIRLEAEPCELEGAPISLERAVLNLIDNAIKWSPPGSEIEVEVSGGGVVTVRDHGPGVAAEDAERIFDRFYRSREARGLPGSGLGLSIVSQVADNDGGTVAVSEAAGGGAEFRLDLSSRAGVPVLT